MAAPILRYPGAKWNIAKWICAHMPPHEVYLDAYFGSGGVFFTKPPSRVETINDIDGDVVNLFQVLRKSPQELADMVRFTPYARAEFLPVIGACGVLQKTGDSLENARRFLVRCWMAHGTRTSDRSGWRHDVQGRQGKNVARMWQGVPDRILEYAERLRDAQIECKPALEVIKRYRYPQVLIYADPPYVLSTRRGRMYANEMTDTDHIELLETLELHPGPVLLSGYACELYDSRLQHWERRTRQTTAEKGQSRQEVLWLNPVAARSLGTLFDSKLPCQG
ncbi:conserved hypothetical protein [uncultured Sporomusa sp.]|uniref:Uncharacterized protein n=1 Tax=uncultured Sporomusa sp. TaxID=307249 RepID=A0A212LY32_9FIRM|nr:DNA adenine methylase [uncultured Sporomusa sp.]SCM82390.1 conserved hypothetical protein [uncultured Sporomusa sp.]